MAVPIMKFTFVSVTVFIHLVSVGCGEKSAEKRDLLDELKNLPPKIESEEIGEPPLLSIDKELQQELKNPTAPEVSFEIQLKILKNLVSYENRLKDLLNGVYAHTEKKLQLARTIAEQNGPIFLKEDIDDEKLKKVYNWDDHSLWFFQDSVKEIKTVWQNITMALEGLPSPMEIFQS